MTIKQASDIFIIKTLIAYQSISDPTVYRRDHARLIQICATPYRWMFDPAHQLWHSYVFPWKGHSISFLQGHVCSPSLFIFWKSYFIIFFFLGQGSFQMRGKFMLENAVRQKRRLAGSLEPWKVLRLKSWNLFLSFYGSFIISGGLTLFSQSWYG